jgi:hypothetical protein
MKQECKDCNKSLEDCTCLEDTIELPNQALKDAAERYIAEDNNNRYYNDFIEGAKWQQERSYSEEEVIELLQKALTHKDDGEIGSLVTAQGEIRPANFFSWFNKFKNK